MIRCSLQGLRLSTFTAYGRPNHRLGHSHCLHRRICIPSKTAGSGLYGAYHPANKGSMICWLSRPLTSLGTVPQISPIVVVDPRIQSKCDEACCGVSRTKQHECQPSSYVGTKSPTARPPLPVRHHPSTA